jgi:large subunit ribosomal protein LX
MANEKFEIEGSFKIGENWKPYTKVIEAPNQNQAVERTFCVIGSKHRLKRNYITIKTVKVVVGE